MGWPHFGGVSPAASGVSLPRLLTMLRMNGEQRAVTAGEQDHSDPGRFRGEVADAPADAGRPPADADADAPADAEFGDPELFSADVATPDGPRTVTWRNCRASDTLFAAVNRVWPMRDTALDGSYGDLTNPSRRSDHHPWLVFLGTRVVRARCFDVNGIDAAWLAEQIRRLGAAGDPRLVSGGYVILNERITSGDWRTWRKYTGADPHRERVHVSFSMSGFDNPAPWLFLEDDTVTPQDLRAVVNGILDTEVPLRASGKGGHTSLRKVITQLERAIVPVRSSEPSETHELVERVSADLSALRDVVTQAITTTTGGH